MTYARGFIDFIDFFFIVLCITVLYLTRAKITETKFFTLVLIIDMAIKQASTKKSCFFII